MGPVGLDTNVIVYGAGIGDPGRCARASALLGRLAGRLVLPVQVLGEFFNVAVRRAGLPRDDVAERLETLVASGLVVETTLGVFRRAADLATSHRFQIWDGVVVAAAEEAGCPILLSEDMQHGFVWRRLTIVNPFLEPPHPLLAEALRHAP